MKCTMNGSQIYVTHSLSSIVGQNLTVEIKRIVNPSSTKPTDPFIVKSEWDVLNDGNYYQIDWNIVDFTYNVTGLTYLLDSSVTRLPMNNRQGY